MQEFRKFTPEEQDKMRQEALRKRAERDKRMAEEAAKQAAVLLSQQPPPPPQMKPMQPIQLKRTAPESFFNPVQVQKKPAIPSTGPKPQLQLVSAHSFEITATPGVLGACKALGITTPPAKDGKLQLQLADRAAILAKLAFNERPLNVHDIPKTVLAAFEASAMAQRQAAMNSNVNLQNAISDKLLQNLFPFQVEGVKRAIRRNGRILIADEMGLGKSLQALAAASFYRLEWPLLIVGPASMVANWREQVYNWIPDLPKEQVQVIFDGKVEALTGDITIMSYDLCVRLADLIKKRHFRVIVADECHALRNSTTKRSKTMVPILQAAQRVILLSGTPALSRPYELHPQISAVNPKLFPKAHEYGIRYCDGHETQFGWDFKGTSNPTELNVVLEQLIMIRRTKDQVLTQLPPKLRQQVFLEIPKEAKRRLKSSTDELLNPDLLVDDASIDELLRSMSGNARYIRLYQETAKAKMPAMLDYVADLLDSGHKFIIFAHHIETLDSFSQYFTKQKVKFIKISGETKVESRHDLCTKFQSEEDVRVAVLSITAASTGLTLTRANLVVFAELHFTPGTLQQAEDRAHRIGQLSPVNIHYLLAKGTADDLIWPLIQRKLQTLESLGLGKNEFSGMRTVDHDPSQMKIDKFFSKPPTKTDSEEINLE